LKQIAVVILNWNGIDLLEKFLPSVVENSPEADIFIADNASTDYSINYVRAHFTGVKIIENKSNLGFAAGYNEALKKVDNPYLVLLNSDVQVTPNWLNPMVTMFENEPQTAILQPKILDYKNKDYFEYAGAAGGFVDQFGYPFCRGRIFEKLEKDNGQYDDVSDIFWASGACFFIRNTVFKALGGFDADFFAHQEEIDFCWRAKNKGFDVKYNSKSVVYHLGGATLKFKNPKKTFLNFRNSLFMLTKNLPFKRLFWVLLVRLILDGLAGIQFVLKGDFLHCKAILKAHFCFYKGFKNQFKKRDKNQLANYFKEKSIVFKYFIKQKTTYLELH
jgi:GT2 family glycosyltransferase